MTNVRSRMPSNSAMRVSANCEEIDELRDLVNRLRCALEPPA